jgi:putative lipase involved disintegration of autophagic bodies
MCGTGKKNKLGDNLLISMCCKKRLTSKCVNYKLYIKIKVNEIKILFHEK